MSDVRGQMSDVGKGRMIDDSCRYFVCDLKIVIMHSTRRIAMKRMIMIHAGGDNDSDLPAKLGGGGTRIACGEVPQHMQAQRWRRWFPRRGAEIGNV